MKSRVLGRRAILSAGAALMVLAMAVEAQAGRFIQNTNVGRTSSGYAVPCNDPTGFAHWANANIAWYHNTGGQGAGKAQAIQNGLASWNAVGPAAHSQTYAGTTSAGFTTDGQNTVLWARGNGCNGSCLAITALVLASGQVITETDVSFSSRYTWNTNGSNYDVEAVWAHEDGHCLGLHHTEVTTTPRPTMYAAYFGTDGRSLHSDDTDALNCSYSRYGLTNNAASIASSLTRPGMSPNGIALASRMRDNGALLRYRMPEGGNVKLRMFDVAGRLVATVVDGYRAAGEHEVNWNGDTTNGRVATGVYFARVESGASMARTTVILVK